MYSMYRYVHMYRVHRCLQICTLCTFAGEEAGEICTVPGSCEATRRKQNNKTKQKYNNKTKQFEVAVRQQ